MFGWFTDITEAVSPLDQLYDKNPPVAVKLVDWPGQILGFPAMLNWGGGNIATCVLAVPMQPFPSVTVTETDKGGVTKILALLSPLLHKIEEKALPTVNVAVAPGHTFVGPAITGTGVGNKSTVLLAVEVQPSASVAVTV